LWRLESELTVMTEKSKNPPASSSQPDLDSLEARVNAAKKRHKGPDREDTDGSLLGMAWRLSTELVVAVLVGTALGHGLDKLFGTSPWILLVGLGFGFAAGIKNTLRVADKMDAKTAHIPIGNDIEDLEDED